MRSHASDSAVATEVQETVVTRGIELQERGPELKSLRPLGPALSRIAAGFGKHWRRTTKWQCPLDRLDALGGSLPKARKQRLKVGWRECFVKLDQRAILAKIVLPQRARRSQRKSPYQNRNFEITGLIKCSSSNNAQKVTSMQTRH
jgi:hypothetical protein